MTKTEKAVKRITEMEEILDEARKRVHALEEALEGFEEYQDKIRELDRYYTGKDWKSDYAMDEKGELPAGLKRGVLSEDAVYDLLEQNQELLELMKGKETAPVKVYDISQEVFGCAVYPGDPSPERIVMMQKSRGAVCNLTAIKMCAHNGTHVDAPYHFIEEGKKIDEVDLTKWVGYAYVYEHEGEITAKDARKILKAAREAEAAFGDGSAIGASRRILIKGKAVLTEEGAMVFAKAKLLLFGNESQTVGPEDAPMAVHLCMLGADMTLLEGIRLSEVPEGIYLLSAAPINLGGADGAPCRAVLISC
ncbi:MAG: DUF4298 domain-containing protein [Lachnospiraceae bacterium]|nr:DUF4298 domain-containing protein [Lachnospiraceae bacterium]